MKGKKEHVDLNADLEQHVEQGRASIVPVVGIPVRVTLLKARTQSCLGCESCLVFPASTPLGRTFSGSV